MWSSSLFLSCSIIVIILCISNLSPFFFKGNIYLWYSFIIFKGQMLQWKLFICKWSTARIVEDLFLIVFNFFDRSNTSPRCVHHTLHSRNRERQKLWIWIPRYLWLHSRYQWPVQLDMEGRKNNHCKYWPLKWPHIRHRTR